MTSETPHDHHILLCPIGSAGDVYPFVGLGVALQRRGHHVTVITNGYFRATCERAGLPFVEVSTAEQYLRLAADPRVWHPFHGFRTIVQKGVAPQMRALYQAIVDRAQPDKTLVLTSCLGFGARIAQDHLGIPAATIHLQPSVIWSDHDPPLLPGVWQHPSVPLWFQRFLFRLGERFVIDRTAGPVINSFRHELGLKPISRVLRWWNSPDLILALFPRWFAPPQPDWPASVRFADFPLWDEDADQPLPSACESFLNEGTPPIVFTCGSAHRFSQAVFSAAVSACQRLGRRGLLVSRFAENISDNLPNFIQHVPYAPFSKLLPRAAAIVHHGGIGTTARALATGIPQLITPMAHDQPDNANRVSKLGVGSVLPMSKVMPKSLFLHLHRLLASESVATSCQVISGRICAVDPFERAGNEIEQLLSRI